MPGDPDYRVEIVDANGDPDMSVAVVGDIVVDLTGATPGEVLTVQPDGTVAADPGGGGGAVDSVNGQTGVVVLDAGDVGAPEAAGLTAIEPRLIDINVFPAAMGHTNWDTIAADAATLYGFRKQSSGAQNDEIYWDVPMSAGTWTIALIHRTSTNLGIYTVSIDGVSVGTIDGYAGAAVQNVRSTITGVAVAAAGVKRVKLKMATKNASSSDYFGGINALRLFRPPS